MNDLARLWQGLAFAVWLLAGCSPDTTAKTPPAATSQPGPQTDVRPKSHSLAIAVYNYTDRYMDSVEVNGQGGGNIGVSWPGSSGQTSTCCVNWTDGSRLPRRVNISWVAGYCKQTLHGEEGESQTMTQPLWKTSDVEFNGPVPANPQNFEVHFYRDDHIELAMTEKDSPARLDLPATADRYTRPGIAVNDPPCAPDYDRAQARRRATRATGQGVTKP